MRLSNTSFFAVVFGLIALLLLPLGLSLAFDPLRPPALEVTATLYVSTESAYSTRTAREDIEAPSVFATIPLDENGDPIEPTEPVSSDSSDASDDIQLVAQVATAVPSALPQMTTRAGITGSSSLELKLFSCHFSTDSINRKLQPNETFQILGWNLDGDDVTYFLIEDDTTRPQVWVQADVSVLLSVANYKDYFPKGAACRTWVLPEANTTPVATSSTPLAAQSPIPLPQIKTATALPPSPFEMILSEADAAQQIAEDVPELKNPEVDFTPSEVRVRGTAEGSGPLGIQVSGGVEVIGTLRIQDKKLVMDVTSVTLNGGDITQQESGQNASAAINTWLRKILVQREIESFLLEEHQLTIVGVQLHENVLPTLVGTPSVATGTAPAIISVTQEMTPTASLPQARSVTFTPVVAPPSDITSEAASIEAGLSLTVIQTPQISFLADRVVIKGSVKPTGQAVSQSLVLEGVMVVRDERLILDATLFTLDGVDAISSEFGTRLLAEINAWWPQLTKSQRITGVQLSNGILKVNP